MMPNVAVGQNPAAVVHTEKPRKRTKGWWVSSQKMPVWLVLTHFAICGVSHSMRIPLETSTRLVFFQRSVPSSPGKSTSCK